MATLYNEVISSIIHGLEREFSYDSLKLFVPIFSMADQSYVRWEANGGIDLQLPAFKLTNRQMYWLCFFHVISRKFIKNPISTVNDKNQYFNDNLNFLKGVWVFREAFKCDPLTETEKREILAQKEELRRLKALVPILKNSVDYYS